MAANFTSADLFAALTAEFPELADVLEPSDGFYILLGALAELAQRAKKRSDRLQYSRAARVVEKLRLRGDSEIQNVIGVSFLEHLDFDGPRGAEAWQRLTPSLQRDWTALHAARRSFHPHGK